MEKVSFRSAAGLTFSMIDQDPERIATRSGTLMWPVADPADCVGARRSRAVPLLRAGQPRVCVAIAASQASTSPEW
jgi:hypothetical protein